MSRSLKIMLVAAEASGDNGGEADHFEIRWIERQALLGKQDAQGAALRDLLHRAAKAAPGETRDALKAILAGASPERYAPEQCKGMVQPGLVA